MNISEKRYILNLLRSDLNCNQNLDYKSINFDNIIKFCFEHKILMHVYNHILYDLKMINDNMNIQKLIFFKSNIRRKQSNYISFFKAFINFLEKNNYKYFIYKGIALQSYIETNCITRVFDDIDVYIYNLNIFEFSNNLLESGFKILNDINKSNCNLEINLFIEWNNEQFSVEIKKDKYFNLIFPKEVIKKNFQECEFATLNVNDTFINMINYLYFYCENCMSLRFKNRYILKYPLEIIKFLENNYSFLDWKYIRSIAKKEKIIHKFRTCIINLADLTNDKKYYEILDNFNISEIDYDNYDIIDKGGIHWNIPYINRYFMHKELSDFIIKHLSGEFYLGEANKNNVTSILCDKPLESSYVFTIEKKQEMLKIKWQNSIPEKMIVYIKLFLYDIYGNFLGPHLPIIIELDEQKAKIFTTWVLNTFESRIEKDLYINHEPNLIGLNLKLNEYDGFIDINLKERKIKYDKIGIKMSFFKKDENFNLIKNYDMITDDKLPYILI